MALNNPNYELEKLLDIWGIDRTDFHSLVIEMKPDQIVTVTITHRLQFDEKQFRNLSKQYALVELKNE